MNAVDRREPVDIMLILSDMVDAISVVRINSSSSRANIVVNSSSGINLLST